MVDFPPYKSVTTHPPREATEITINATVNAPEPTKTERIFTLLTQLAVVLYCLGELSGSYPITHLVGIGAALFWFWLAFRDIVNQNDIVNQK